MMSVSAQIANFCDDCDFCDECGDYDFAFGAPRYMSETTCPGCGDPDDLGCPRHEEYADLLAEYDVIEEREVFNNGKNDR